MRTPKATVTALNLSANGLMWAAIGAMAFFLLALTVFSTGWWVRHTGTLDSEYVLLEAGEAPDAVVRHLAKGRFGVHRYVLVGERRWARIQSGGDVERRPGEPPAIVYTCITGTGMAGIAGGALLGGLIYWGRSGHEARRRRSKTPSESR